MSKSHQDPRSRIHINDDPESIGGKIRLALTDLVPGVSYDPNSRPGVSNLLVMMSSLDAQGRSVEDLAKICDAMSMREFKAEVTLVISEGLAVIRDRYNRFVKDDRSQDLDDIANEGSNKARKQAQKIMSVVRRSVGL